jgi:hypothetical protein
MQMSKAETISSIIHRLKAEKANRIYRTVFVHLPPKPLRFDNFLHAIAERSFVINRACHCSVKNANFW